MLSLAKLQSPARYWSDKSFSVSITNCCCSTFCRGWMPFQ